MEDLEKISDDELFELLDWCGHDGYYNDLYNEVVEELKRRLKK